MPQNPESTSDFPAKLSQPARRALAGIGCTELAHLTKYTEAEIKALHGMGSKGITQLREALQHKGLDFAQGKS